MSNTLDELERSLGLLAAEQRKLAELLISQRAAMSKLDTRSMEKLGSLQESARGRIAAIETRRRGLCTQAARELRIALAAGAEPTLTQIAEACDPIRRTRLLAIRDDLRQLVNQVAAASHVAGRLAGAVLGHLNMAMRMVSTAMQGAGTYTRQGTPRVSGRLGAVELVG